MKLAMHLTLVSALTSFASSAAAVEAFAPTDAELTFLPPFCSVKLRQPQGSPQYKALEAQYGRANWVHLHHYCFAVNFVNRARQATHPEDKRYRLESAQDNYEYIISHAAPNFFMRPQVYVELGNVLMQLKRSGEALKMYSDAIAFEPRYAPAYIALVEFYRKNGSRPKALEAASSGLRYAPENRYLQTAYLELGGKKPFPEPVAAVTAVDSQTERASGAVAESTPEAQKAEPEAEVPSSGCRFCPPDTVQERWRASFEDGQ